ncbi:MAG: tyrosine-type recombinase/integrase, partial [Planctomycetia bacterium]|nr:tyrosine-type recombinase/integrase [Planctomycetia bacterium]
MKKASDNCLQAAGRKTHPGQGANNVATLTRKGDVFNVAFRFSGLRFQRSLETENQKKAEGLLANIEETMALIKRGRIEIPDGLTTDQMWQFVRSGGKQTSLPRVVRTVPQSEVWTAYLDSFPAGSKAETSLATERVHCKHFITLLGDVSFQSITPAILQRYVAKRGAMPGLRGRLVQPDTICKELQTFRQVWEFARHTERLVSGENPVHQVRKGRGSEKAPFQVFALVTKQSKSLETALAALQKSKVGPAAIKEISNELAQLWESVYLAKQDILDLLDYVEVTATEPESYPAICMVALTGCRRSEMMRSEKADWNFDAGAVSIRETKRKKRHKAASFRQVDIHPRLAKVIKEWFADHPGGKYAFAKAGG